jgi:hypothetical protein
MLANGAFLRVGGGSAQPGRSGEDGGTHPSGAVVGSAMSAAAGLAGDSKGALRGSCTGGEFLGTLTILAQLPLRLLAMLRNVVEKLQSP